MQRPQGAAQRVRIRGPGSRVADHGATPPPSRAQISAGVSMIADVVTGWF